jgi:hypothetical protein
MICGNPQNDQIRRLKSAPHALVARGDGDAPCKLETRGSQKIGRHIK